MQVSGKKLTASILVLALICIAAIALIMRSERGGAKIVNMLTPSSSYVLEADISYGDHPRHKLDIYKAKQSGDDKPVIVFFHGGGWNRGDKSMYKFVAEAMTSQGYDTALPNYRLYPEVTYPEFLKDSAAATAKVQQIYPTRSLVLMGHSAGAYIAMMMGFAPEYLQSEGVEPCYTLKGIVSLAGPTGALPMTDEPYITIFPDRLLGDDGAMAHTKEAIPPLLLVTGEQDESVNYMNSVKLEEALEETPEGRDVSTLILYPQADHIDVIAQFSRLKDKEGTVKEDVSAYIAALADDEGDGFCR